MPTPSIHKSNRVTRLDKKKDKDKKKEEESELKKWKEEMKQRIDDYIPYYDSLIDRIYYK